jgi:hypothetical protein
MLSASSFITQQYEKGIMCILVLVLVILSFLPPLSSLSHALPPLNFLRRDTHISLRLFTFFFLFPSQVTPRTRTPCHHLRHTLEVDLLLRSTTAKPSGSNASFHRPRPSHCETFGFERCFGFHCCP